MKIEDFKAILKRLQDVYAAGGMTSPAKDLRDLARLFEGSRADTVDEFIAETKALLETPPRSREPVNDERVSVHSARLLDAGTDQFAFEAALDALDADRGLSTAEWYAIANRYRNVPSGANHVYKFKSVKAARAAIRDVFIERFESQSKRGVLERILRWAS
jgi:hypothetical protein